MTESKETKGLVSVGEAKPKQPYHKPTVRSERVFEVRALSCGKVQPTQYGCGHNRHTS
jgi:hypothetical protein